MKIGILTSGGLAPCLSAAISMLLKKYKQHLTDYKILLYLDGYKGVRDGKSIIVTKEITNNADILLSHGGSPIGNSRVKLTDVGDDYTKNKVSYEKIALQLKQDGIDVLHVIGGDDTNTTSANLAGYLRKIRRNITIIGLPKTIDNDIFPIAQTLGCQTAAENSALFFSHIVHENTAHPRMLTIHEVMGRNSGWLTAMSAYYYRERILKKKKFMPEIGLCRNNQDIHAIFLPEMVMNIASQANRLKKIMDKHDDVNIFVSEGAGLDIIKKEMKSRGKIIEKDAFGHIKLDKVNSGEWFGDKLGKELAAEKILVQKSGYFARSGHANKSDICLIEAMAAKAVESALSGDSGVIGNDSKDRNKLKLINFNRIKGKKRFDLKTNWFVQMMNEIGQKI